MLRSSLPIPSTNNDAVTCSAGSWRPVSDSPTNSPTLTSMLHIIEWVTSSSPVTPKSEYGASISIPKGPSATNDAGSRPARASDGSGSV